MAKMKPWYKVVEPREDLKEGRPIDASEFAVHLDKVRAGSATKDYTNPELFMARTYLTKTLTETAGEILRRLSGETTQTSAVFNMSTQFGGGKTHALTLLYHLAKGGTKANTWRDVSKILDKARLHSVPDGCAVATFVGTEFDSIQGRGGKDGTPLRRTPWGEIAYQLGGKESFAKVVKHDEEFTDPKGDVIQEIIPKDKPSLILMDEIINYVSTYRDKGYHNKLYNFIQCLSETVRGLKNCVLVVSIPKSEMSYTQDDDADQHRFKNMLDRLGKAVMMSAETETAEIIRRRLFDWDEHGIDHEGKVILPADAAITCREYAEWISRNQSSFPQWFPFDHARETFQATYPFHPSLLSVFERKWQGLPRFQQTRGILRLLALWVSNLYVRGTRGSFKDPLIGLGTAPLDDSLFRAAVFEQLGETKLEGAVTTDIEGRLESHAIRLDKDAEDTIRKAQVHKKVATSVFFESNGGTNRNTATQPEIRLAVADPDLDIGNIDTALETLVDNCYYLNVERNQYRFGLKENLNKRFADRKASVKQEEVNEIIKEEVLKVLPIVDGIERIAFPEKSVQIPDRPAVTLVIAAPEQSIQDDPDIVKNVEKMTFEYGNSSRSYKSSLIWVVSENSANLRDEARRLKAWEDIENEGLQLDESQVKQLSENIRKAKRDLKESVWRTYKNVFLLGKDNTMHLHDMGLVTSSAAENLTKYIIGELRRVDEIAKDYMPRKLVQNWSPAFNEWSTKSVRDAFYASPVFPRLLYQDAIREMIARGVAEGQIAYVSKAPDGGYEVFEYKKSLRAEDIEISDDVYIIKADEAERYKKPQELRKLIVTPDRVRLPLNGKQVFTAKGIDQFDREMVVSNINWSCNGGGIDLNGVFQASNSAGSFTVVVKSGGITGAASVIIETEEPEDQPTPVPKGKAKIKWSGEVTPQKWMNLYTKVLTRYVKDGDLKIRVNIEAIPNSGANEQQVEETKSALRELGLTDDVEIE